MKADSVDIFEMIEKQRYCKECGEVDVEGRKQYCEECRKERRAVRLKTYHKFYQQKPKVKAKYKEIYKTEKYKKRVKKYQERPENIKKARESQWKLIHGIKEPEGGWGEIWEIKKEQKYCCAICGKHESQFDKNLSLDHDHETGKIRGFLCNKHNMLLGCAEDNINILYSAIDYLKRKL